MERKLLIHSLNIRMRVCLTCIKTYFIQKPRHFTRVVVLGLYDFGYFLVRSFFRKKTHYERDNLDPSLNKSEIAYSELRKATKSEAKGRVDDAIRTYNQIIKDFPNKIGRASCRERVQISVVAVSLKKKNKKETKKEKQKEKQKNKK